MDDSVSPFTPGKPAPIELFVGRTLLVGDVRKVVRQVRSGRQENVTLIGERGIGKTSLASYARHIARDESDFVGVHIHLGGVRDLDDLVRCILERVLETGHSQPYGARLFDLLRETVGGVSVAGLGVTFQPKSDRLADLRRRFPHELKRIVDIIREEHAGLFLVLDDLSTFSDNVEFANWLKAFVDTVGVDYPDEYAVLLMVVGLPEDRERLFKAQPSLLRAFKLLKVKRLQKPAVIEFFTDAFESIGMSVSPQAMTYMVNWSGGLPVVMHQIGDAAFDLAKTDTIDAPTARRAVFEAAERIGQTYLEEPVYRAIRSPAYRSTLRKLGDFGQVCFTKHEIEEHLTAEETKVFHNFLRKMREVGVIEHDPEGGVGGYRFTNGIYMIYAFLEARRNGAKLEIGPTLNELNEDSLPEC